MPRTSKRAHALNALEDAIELVTYAYLLASDDEDNDNEQQDEDEEDIEELLEIHEMIVSHRYLSHNTNAGRISFDILEAYIHEYPDSAFLALFRMHKASFWQLVEVVTDLCGNNLTYAVQPTPYTSKSRCKVLAWCREVYVTPPWSWPMADLVRVSECDTIKERTWCKLELITPIMTFTSYISQRLQNTSNPNALCHPLILLASVITTKASLYSTAKSTGPLPRLPEMLFCTFNLNWPPNMEVTYLFQDFPHK